MEFDGSNSTFGFRQPNMLSINIEKPCAELSEEPPYCPYVDSIEELTYALTESPKALETAVEPPVISTDIDGQATNLK